MEDIIKETQNVLSNGGNIIKTRDDRELILVDKDGNIQNTDSCGWLPENDGKINKSVFRTRIEPWLTSLFQSEHLSLLCGSGITNAVSFLAGGSMVVQRWLQALSQRIKTRLKRPLRNLQKPADVIVEI